MKYYHGSPQNLTVLKPQKGKGRNSFENQIAVFLTKDFLHAALYAIGKTLKGKTPFAVSNKKLIIVGRLKPSSGYVYEVDVSGVIKGPNNQFAYKKEIKPTRKTKVHPKDYQKNIIYVKDMKELMKTLNIVENYLKSL